jgi:hypothetical protein
MYHLFSQVPINNARNALFSAVDGTRPSVSRQPCGIPLRITLGISGMRCMAPTPTLVGDQQHFVRLVPVQGDAAAIRRGPASAGAATQQDTRCLLRTVWVSALATRL